MYLLLIWPGILIVILVIVLGQKFWKKFGVAQDNGGGECNMNTHTFRRTCILTYILKYIVTSEGRGGGNPVD